MSGSGVSLGRGKKKKNKDHKTECVVGVDGCICSLAAEGSEMPERQGNKSVTGHDSDWKCHRVNHQL